MERIAILTDVLAFAPCQRVISRAVVEQGRQALRVELQHGLGPEAMFQKPTFVITSTALSDGIVEVDILARRSRGALPASQASAGIAFRINGSARAFEAVYLCPVNGRPMKPRASLDRQAVKYFAYPEHLHAPTGGGSLAGSSEAGADIRPDSWIGLKLEINGPSVKTFVEGKLVLEVQGNVPPTKGAIGLWVDIGTEAYFSNFHVTA